MVLIIALGFTFGAWCLQQQATLPNVQITWLFISCLVACFYLQRCFKSGNTLNLYRHLCLLALAVFAGFLWAAALATLRLDDALPRAWEQKSILIEGVISSLPERTERGERFNVDVEKVFTQQAQIPKHISLNYYQDASSITSAQPSSLPRHFHAGERWQFTVRLKRPHTTYNPNGFDFEAWALSEHMRATGNIRNKSGFKRVTALVWQPQYLIAHLREQVGNYIQQGLPDKPYAGVIRALVIGDDSQISQQEWNVYLRTGTNHLMSISGLHITMLSGLAFALVSWLWRRAPSLVLRFPAIKAASIAGMVTALMYAALAGFSVPTQRTVYMLMTVGLMLLWGRKLSMPRILSLALLMVVILDPWAVIAPGFWLSFGAVAVIAFAMGARLTRPPWWQEAINTQWAVTIGLLPALVLMFGQFSIVSPIANALAIPVLSFMVVPLAILGSVLHIDSLLVLAHWVLQTCMPALTWLAHWPAATWQQAAPSAWAMLLAVLGVIWLLMPKGVPLKRLGLVCMLPMMFPVVPTPMPNAMQVTVLDVGQGLSVVVQTAQHTLLYDAGSRYNAQSDAGSRIVVPFLRSIGVSKLSGVIISHDDIDHSGGMPSVFAQMPVAWLVSSLSQTSEFFQSEGFLQQALKPTQIVKCTSNQHWVWDGVTFEILSPTANSYQEDFNDNNRSCVLKISSQYGSILIPGDAEQPAEQFMLEQYAQTLKSDVLIAPHHGSKTSSSPAFLQAVAPTFIVVTNGYLNRFGHPKPVIVERYLSQHAHVFRSDYHGALQLQFNTSQSVQPISWRKVSPKYWHDTYP